MFKTMLFVAAATIAAAAAPKGIREVMLEITVPESTAVFEVSESPKTPGEWAAARAHAVKLIESGDLLLASAQLRDDAEWIAQVRAYVAASAQLVKAADMNDFDAWLAASDGAAETCVNCHKRYLDAR